MLSVPVKGLKFIMASFISVASWILILHVYLAPAQSLSDEKRLIKHLLENYEKIGIVGRPVFNTSETVRLSLGIALIQILDLDEANQVLTTSVWQRHLWNDILLKWNPEDFGGVDHVRLPATAIWTPDIYLYNSVEKSNIDQTSALAVVSSDGNVLWIVPMIYKSTCSIDLQLYPRDTQICKWRFGSWTYDGFKLDVSFYDNMEEIDITDYIISNEWQLTEHHAIKNVKYYPCCEEPYPHLTFSLGLKRLPGAYEYRITLPVVSLALLVLFFLPPKSAVKIHMAMFVFIIYLALMLSMVSRIPPSPFAIPHIMHLTGAGMCMCLLSMILSVITMNVAENGHRGIPLPAALKKIFNGVLGCVFCVCHGDDNMDDKSNQAKAAERDWEIFATVLDRIFFTVYVVIAILIATVMSA